MKRPFDVVWSAVSGAVQGISSVLWRLGSGVVNLFGHPNPDHQIWSLVVSSLKETTALVILACLARIVEAIYALLGLSAFALAILGLVHKAALLHVNIGMIQIMMRESKGVLGILAAELSKLLQSRMGGIFTRPWAARGAMAAAMGVLVTLSYWVGAGHRITLTAHAGPAPGTEETRIVTPVPGNPSAGLKVTTTPVLGGSANDRDRVLHDVEEETGTSPELGPVRFDYSEVTPQLDEQTQQTLRAEAERNGDAMILEAYQVGDEIRFELIPAVHNSFVRGTVFFEPLAANRANLKQVAHQIGLALRAARAEVMFERGAKSASIEEIKSLLEEEANFPKGLDAGDFHAKLADFLAAAKTGLAVSSESAATALAEFTKAAEAYQKSHRLSDYRSTLNNHALLLLALHEPDEALGVIDRALVDSLFDADPAEWIQSKVNRSLIVLQLARAKRQSLAEECIRDLEYALRHVPAGLPSHVRAKLNNTLGMLYVCNDKGDGVRAASAVPLYEEAVDIFTPLCELEKPLCPSLAAVENNLANSLRRLRSGDRQPRLERASDLLFNALKFRTKEADPQAWAASMLNLALVQAELGELTGDQALVGRAIAATESVLSEPAFHSDAGRWAIGQEILANAHSQWPGAGRPAHVLHAKQLFEAAAQVFETSGDNESAHRCREEAARMEVVLSVLKRQATDPEALAARVWPNHSAAPMRRVPGR